MSDTGRTGSAAPTGARLAVDVGEVRIGIAASDSTGVLATPVETVRRGRGDVARIIDLAVERDAVGIFVGHPRTLSGRAGAAVEAATAFARALVTALAERSLDVSVRLIDERLTTVSAERVLASRGVKGTRRRAVVDQAAAVVILQHALDTERSTGRAAGEEVECDA